ncbi:MAG: type II secretion system protein GspE, partial [bacterium]|nr:type II secretion system protein GspE [bacterium]
MEVKKRQKIVEFLVESGFITKEQLDNALTIQKHTGEKLGRILIKHGYISEDVFMAILAKQLGVEYVSLQDYGELDPNVIKLIPESYARKNTLIPLELRGDTLTVAMADPI